MTDRLPMAFQLAVFATGQQRADRQIDQGAVAIRFKPWRGSADDARKRVGGGKGGQLASFAPLATSLGHFAADSTPHRPLAFSQFVVATCSHARGVPQTAAEVQYKNRANVNSDICSKNRAGIFVTAP